MEKDRVLAIRSRLMSVFSPTELEVIDESHLHAGHPGARDGRGHYRVNIVSNLFTGRSRLECHRMVFAALGKMMETDIHALSVTASAQSPEQTH